MASLIKDREREPRHIILKRSPQFVAGLLLALAVLAPLVVAQEEHITRENGVWSQVFTGSMAAAKNLKVRVDAGAVVVRGSRQSGIDYALHVRSHASSEEDARRQFQAYKLSAYVHGDTAWVVGEWQGGHSMRVGPTRVTIMTGSDHKFAGELVVNVPRNMEVVRIETGGGAVDASGVTGQVDIHSGGGKVRVDDIGGSATLETGGDSVDVGTVGGDLKLETGGGNITIRSVKGVINAETGGGNVTVLSGDQGATVQAGGGNVDIKHCSGKVKAETGGGNIDLGDIGGAAEIETGGGSIRLTSAKGAVRAHTGGGSIELYGVPSARVETGAGAITVKLVNTGAAQSDSTIETAAGDITVYIASDVAMSVRASVDLGNGHRITSELPDIHVRSEGDQWSARTLTAEGKLNGGGPVLKVRTSTGDICFRRANQ
jgi:DUF4097 and DUF4098 domain-containing protein YvlB